jgi:predicted RNase H-like nuclease (RuvC/YqgF family)
LKKQSTIEVTLARKDREKLNEIAVYFGYFWGKRPNVSALITALARGEVGENARAHLDRERINQLQKELVEAHQKNDALEGRIKSFAAKLSDSEVLAKRSAGLLAANAGLRIRLQNEEFRSCGLQSQLSRALDQLSTVPSLRKKRF